MHDDNSEILPEWLREPGVEPPRKKGPESGKPSGQSFDGRVKVPQQRTASQAGSSGSFDPSGPSGPDGRKLMPLAALDKSLPHLDLSAYRPRLEWQELALSSKQAQYLESIGIDPAGISRGLGAKILDYFRNRRERGLASFKQLLALIGADVPNAESVDFETAKRILAERYGQQPGGPR
jgi:hypothetical protein